MAAASENGSNYSVKKRIFLTVTNLVSLACLWWVLHDLNWSESLVEIREMNWWWVSLAVITDITVYVFHGWRWSLLLSPVERIPIMRSIRAIYVGLFANEILPLRTGEVLRCYLQARWSSIPFSVTLASAFIERIFDGFWLVLCLFITVKLVPGLPKYIVDGAAVLGVLIIAGALLVAIAMFHRHRAKSALSEHGWHRHVRILIDDLHMIGHSRYLYYAALATLPYLLTQIIPIYALMRAYDFADASWGVATVLMIVLRLGSAVPQAPGNVGAFQALTVVVLSQVFGYDSGFAKRFSLMMWAVVTLPLLIVGFIALVVTGARIGELSQRAKAEIPVAKH
jgi:uncharacterized protein (TIRG00374 family)